MLEIVDYIPEHFHKIVPLECHKTEIPDAINLKGVTVLCKGEVLAIMGWYLIMPGVAQIWSFLAEGVKKFPVAFPRSVKKMIQFYFEHFGIRRMQFSVRCGYAVGWRWAHCLGFSCEGIMKTYGADGSDYWLFARTKWAY